MYFNDFNKQYSNSVLITIALKLNIYLLHPTVLNFFLQQSVYCIFELIKLQEVVNLYKVTHISLLYSKFLLRSEIASR